MSDLYIKQELIKTLPQIDALILDIDGVVLDVSQSFREVISHTTQLYATTRLGVEDNGPLLPVDQIDGFKMAGGFNSDWDLTNAAVALVVAKHARGDGNDTASLAASAPDWAEWTREIKRRGGGLVQAEKLILEMLNATQRREFSLNWNQKLVTQLFQEMYGGVDACKTLYGFEPQHLQVEGFYKREQVILDASLLPPKLPVGILTGRTRNEAHLALKFADLRKRIPETHWVTEDDGVRKPDGQTLSLMAEKMKFRHAVYIGDVWDDWQTVVNYRGAKSSQQSRVTGAIVLAGEHADEHRRTFLEAGAEIIAPDANSFLSYLKHVLAN